MRGQIELICGPMFAGKTTELIRRLTEAQDAGVSIAAVKPALDVRYAADRIVTHDGQALAVTPIASVGELSAACGDAAVVGIDEAHFFGEDSAKLCRRFASAGRRVIAAGVDYDHRGVLFPAVAALKQVADRVTVLTARCTRCGAVANFTQRMVAGDAPIVVGGVGDYEPRCRNCFEPAHDQGSRK